MEVDLVAAVSDIVEPVELDSLDDAVAGFDVGAAPSDVDGPGKGSILSLPLAHPTIMSPKNIIHIIFLIMSAPP